MVDSTVILLKSKFEPIEKMTVEQLKAEVQLWRKLWNWLDSAVKYYLSRTGSLVGVQIRNYHRYVGVLLETKWELKEVEIGVYEKVYNQTDGQYYYERKIVKLPANQIISWDWIAERTPEKEILEHNLRAGFASHGNGVEMVQIAILIGPKNSPAGYVWAKTFACLKSGKEALLAVLEPNLTVKPPTLIVPTVKIKSLRQASIIYGPVQAAVGKAIQDMVEEELITQNMIEDYVLIVKVHAFPEAVNRQLIYANTYHAVVKALKSAFGEG